jgi:hypothetical protein
MSVVPPAYGSGVNTLIIDCDDCSHQHTSICDDCVVTFICSQSERETVVVDATERLALRRLSAAGLVPALRHAPRSG